MNPEELAKAIGRAELPIIAVTPTGERDAEQTAEIIARNICRFCQTTKTIENLDALALAVCHYAATADTLEAKQNAERAAAALADAIALNEQFALYAETLELIAVGASKYFGN